MIHAFRLGPLSSGGYAYVALAEGGEPRVHEAPSDRAGLTALKGQAGGEAIACEPALAAAGKGLGLESAPLPPAVLRARALLAYELASGIPRTASKPDAIAEFLEGAAAFWRAQSWEVVAPEERLRVALQEGSAEVDGELSVVGGDGTRLPGVALCDARGALDELARLDGAARAEAAVRLANLTVDMERDPEWAAEALDEGFRLPRVPMATRKRGGAPAPMVTQDLLVSAALLQAIAAWTALDDESAVGEGVAQAAGMRVAARVRASDALPAGPAEGLTPVSAAPAAPSAPEPPAEPPAAPPTTGEATPAAESPAVEEPAGPAGAEAATDSPSVTPAAAPPPGGEAEAPPPAPADAAAAPSAPASAPPADETAPAAAETAPEPAAAPAAAAPAPEPAAAPAAAAPAPEPAAAPAAAAPTLTPVAPPTPPPAPARQPSAAPQAPAGEAPPELDEDAIRPGGWLTRALRSLRGGGVRARPAQAPAPAPRAPPARGAPAARRAPAPSAAARPPPTPEPEVDGADPFAPFARALLVAIPAEPPPPSPADEAGAAELGGRVVEAAQRSLGALVSFPAVALEIVERVNDPKADARGVAGFIARDPALAADVLSIANSAAFRGASEIESVHEAVARLGLGEVGRIASAVAARKVLDPVGAGGARASTDQFVRAVAVATTAAGAALRQRGARSDHAWLGGLLHDVGRALARQLLAQLAAAPGAHLTPVALGEAVVERVHVEVGQAALRQWALPAYLVEICARHHDAVVPAEAVDLHLVRLTSALAHLADPALGARAAREVVQSAAALRMNAVAVRALATDLKVALERARALVR